MSAPQVSQRRKRSWSETAPYIPAEQLAEMIQVSHKTIYRWAAEDATMPTLRIGGVVRFPRDRVLRWLQAREQGFGRARSAKPLSGEAQTGVNATKPHAQSGSCAEPCAEDLR